MDLHRPYGSIRIHTRGARAGYTGYTGCTDGCTDGVHGAHGAHGVHGAHGRGSEGLEFTSNSYLFDSHICTLLEDAIGRCIWIHMLTYAI